MKIEKTDLEGVYVIELEPFVDDRGMFYRVFCENELKSILGDRKIVNINASHTKKKGSIRGMHYQYPPKAECKIVRCNKGKIFDVAVDIRKDSKTYLKWHGEMLTEDNMKMLFVDEGFAHGFQSLEDDVRIEYLVTEFYGPNSEGGIRYNDPKIGIEWPFPVTDISDKDKNHKDIDKDFKSVEL